MTCMEFDIMQYLAMQNGRTVTYKELYETVWHSEFLFDDESIMAHIHRIDYHVVVVNEPKTYNNIVTEYTKHKKKCV